MRFLPLCLRPIVRLVRACALLLALAGLPSFACATGIPVVDVAACAHIAGQTTMQLLEFGREIENQGQQISQYAQQIQQLSTMIGQGREALRIAGDPAQLLHLIGSKEIAGASGLGGVTQLLQSPTAANIFSRANPGQSLAYSGSQMYSSGRALGQTLPGTGAQRDLSLYKNFSALEGLFTQLQGARAQDRTVQQAMTTKMAELTGQLGTAKDNATRDTLLAGIHAAKATMDASTAEVAKAHADYLANNQARRVQEEKAQVASQESWDAQVKAAGQAHAAAASAQLTKQHDAFQANAAQIESRSPGLTSNGEEIIRIPLK